MKKSVLTRIAVLSSVAVIAATIFAASKANKCNPMLAGATSPYTIADDEYEAAFLEQYNNEPNAAPSDLSKAVEDYSYTNDKPLGNNSIGGHQYGNAGPSSSYLKIPNFESNLLGVNETLQWKFSYMHVLSKSNPNRLYVQIENNSSDKNICNTTAFPSGEYPDEYAIGQLITGEGYAKGAVMYTATAINNVQDFSFYWRSSYAQKVYIVYKIDGGSWKILGESGNPNGNYVGTRGWDAYGFTSFNYASWNTHELKGATAQIGIACTEAPTESGSLPVSAVLINANKSSVRYLNSLTYKEGICGTSVYDLRKDASNNVHNQDLFHLITEHASGEFLAEYEVAGTKSSETNALSLYNYLVGEIPALGSAK